MLPFLTLPAEMRPGYGLQPGLGDAVPTSLADAKRALSDPRKRLFYSAHETTVGLMQPDLKLGFGIGICLIDEVPLRIPSSQCMRSGFGTRIR